MIIKINLTATQTDLEILSLLRSPPSREKGFDMLLTQYQERVYWQVRKMVEGHEDAADVTQEVWSKVVRHIEKFNGESGLYTWLFRIAHNESINFLNKKKTQRERSHSNTKLVSQEVTQDVSEEDVWTMLRLAMDKLPEKQRLVFELRYFEEMPYQKMSDTLGTSVGALKASYHIAVKKIEAHVKAVCWT